MVCTWATADRNRSEAAIAAGSPPLLVIRDILAWLQLFCPALVRARGCRTKKLSRIGLIFGEPSSGLDLLLCQKLAPGLPSRVKVRSEHQAA